MIAVEIQSISFDESGHAEVSFYLPESDVKAPGVARMQTLIIPKGFEYDDELDAVLEAAKVLVLDVMEDFEQMPSAFAQAEPE